MPFSSRLVQQRIVQSFDFGVKRRHKARFRSIDRGKLEKLGSFAHSHYTNVHDEGDLIAAMESRLESNRREVVPWIDAALPLQGSRLLEIGCGTGESTLALAEQGAVVTGIDMDEGALAVGRERCQLYGCAAELIVNNAVEAVELFANRQFDIIVFFASLEHMTLDERLEAMRGTWSLLRPGGIWCVNEAPNRLWYWDGHTSMENFYNWLPDELAGRWAHRSKRAAFAKSFPAGQQVDPLLLARWGRGVSFHEFDLAFGDVRSLDIVSNKRDFLVQSNALRFAHRLFSQTTRYEIFLETLEPKINPGFFRPYLDIIIRKPAR